MNRRGFLGSILLACAAPAIVRADSLMRIVPVMVDVEEIEPIVLFAHPSLFEQIKAVRSDMIKFRRWLPYVYIGAVDGLVRIEAPEYHDVSLAPHMTANQARLEMLKHLDDPLKALGMRRT